jgi:hypothetical protein
MNQIEAIHHSPINLSKTEMMTAAAEAGKRTPEWYKSFPEAIAAAKAGKSLIFRDTLPRMVGGVYIGRDYAGDSGILDSYVMQRKNMRDTCDIADPDSELTEMIRQHVLEMAEYQSWGVSAEIRIQSQLSNRIETFANEYLMFLRPDTLFKALAQLSRRRGEAYAHLRGVDPEEFMSSIEYSISEFAEKDSIRCSAVLDKVEKGVYHFTFQRRPDGGDMKEMLELKVTFDSNIGQRGAVRESFKTIGDKVIPDDIIRACAAWFADIQALDIHQGDKVLAEFGLPPDLSDGPNYFQTHLTSPFQEPTFILSGTDMKSLEAQGFHPAIEVQGKTDTKGGKIVECTSNAREVDMSSKNHLVQGNNDSMKLEVLSRSMETCIQLFPNRAFVSSHHTNQSLMYKPDLYIAAEEAHFAGALEHQEKIRVHVVSDGKHAFYKLIT